MNRSSKEYAAFRAECCKADIEIDSKAHARVQKNKLTPEERRAKHRVCCQSYRERKKSRSRLASESGVKKIKSIQSVAI